MNGPSTAEGRGSGGGADLHDDDGPLSFRPTDVIPRPRSGGVMPSDDDLLGRILTFSGTYVSDDGSCTIRRSPVGSFEYSGHRFVGYCRRCVRGLLIAPEGEPLRDIGAAIRFAATHDHDEVD